MSSVINKEQGFLPSKILLSSIAVAVMIASISPYLYANVPESKINTKDSKNQIGLLR